MKLDFDPITDFPDPLAGLSQRPIPPPATPPARSPTRSQTVARRAWALGAALLCQGAWLWIFNKRGDLAAVPAMTLIAEFTIPLAAALLALAVGAAPGERGLGTTRGRLAAGALFSPALFALATVFAGPSDVDSESFWPHALRCFLVTTLMALGPLVLAAWAFRGAFVVGSAWRMAALGMACGASAAACMSLICSVGSPAHVLVGHGGTMLVAGLAGALLGRRLGEP